MVTDERNSRNEMKKYTNDEIGVTVQSWFLSLTHGLIVQSVRSSEWN